MELLNMVEFRPAFGDQFDVITVPYLDGSTSKKKRLLVTAMNDAGVGKLRVVDVTDPRNPIADYITFTYRERTAFDNDNGTMTNLGVSAVYIDENSPSSGTFNGDVFVVIWTAIPVPDEDDRPVRYGSESDQLARFVLINLSKAVALRQSGSTSLIEIYNAGVRNVKYAGTKLSPENQDIYVGVIKSKNIKEPHTLGFDQKSGILALPTIHPTRVGTVDHAFTDLFDLKQIVVACAPGLGSPWQQAPAVLSSLTMSNGDPIDIPVVSHNGNTPLLYPHDIVPEFISSTCVRLYIGSTTTGDPATAAGGIATIDVFYSTPGACSLANATYWAYDMDRARPDYRYSSNTNWSYRQTHTAAPFHHTNGSDVFVVTTDEFAGTRYSLYETGVNAISAVGGTWITNPDSEIEIDVDYTSAILEDDKRLGAFVRVWNTQVVSGLRSVDGTGTNDGPLSLYDPIEAEPLSNDLYYSTRTSVPSTSIVVSAYAGTPSLEKVGPNTVHRVHTISPYNTSMYTANNDDVLLSAYAAGCRVFNLGATASTGVTVEKAFFDFIPKLNFDKNSDYFYKLNSGFQPLWSYIAWNNIGMYFTGVWHSVADFGSARVGTNGTSTLPADEKFIHVMSYGEGRIADDPNTNPDNYAADPTAVATSGARNWLFNGGFMMLRYFDGKLGGTISGYTGTDNWRDKSYRTVNLQGDFTVDRDVTVASGATVNLLPGHNTTGMLNSTSLTTASNRTIYVDGILNISIPDGDPEGTDIVINVPIVVRTGGQLNVYKIHDSKRVVFKQPVTVNSNGSWTMHESSNVELYGASHTSNGMFTISGTSNGRVTFTGRRAATGVAAQGSLVKGVGTYTNPPGAQTTNFSIHYADCTNAYFDMTDIQTAANITELKNSNFERTVMLNIKPCLVKVDKHGDYRRFQNPNNPLYSVFRVLDCTFSENISGVGSPRDVGLEVTRSGVVRIDNSTFSDLRTGAFVDGNLQVNVDDCTFEGCTNGFHSESVTGSVCSSTFTNNEFSVTSAGQPTIELYDNGFGGTIIGDRAWGGGRHWLRNNTFTTYGRGVAMGGTVAYMRNRVIGGGQDHEFGYNNFMSQYANFTFDTQPIPVHDVSLTFGGQVFVDCGYNNFDSNSTYHVFSDVAYNVNASQNRWTNAGPIYVPRLSPGVTYTGAPLDVQGDREEDCGPVIVTHTCEPPITYCGPRDDPKSLTAPTSGLYTTIGLLRTDALDGTISPMCRRSIVWEYFENVRHTDSTALYAQLKSDMATIVANTSLPSYLRSAALHVKAKTYVDLKQLDSARTAYNSILTSYTSSVDSVPANWAVLNLNVIEDTTGHTDSLHGVHMDRIIFDLRRTISNGGMAKETANDDRTATSADGSLSFVSVVPNPARDECRFTFDAKKAGSVAVEIVSSDGIVLKRFATTFVRGTNVFTESLTGYTAGLYFVRCTMDGMSVSMPLTVTP